MGCKGLSETPLHFILRYKGDSVGRYRRYLLKAPTANPLKVDCEKIDVVQEQSSPGRPMQNVSPPCNRTTSKMIR